MTLVGVGGEPLGAPAPTELKEHPISPKVNADLKKAQEDHAAAQTEAAEVGLQTAQFIALSVQAAAKLDSTKNELKRVMARAAKSSGIKESRIKGFNTERGMALYE